MKTLRNLVEENYHIERWLAPAILRVIKPDGEKYVYSMEDDHCSCPARGECCHQMQAIRLIQAQRDEYAERRKLIARHNDVNLQTMDAIDRQLCRIERAEWELDCLIDLLCGGDFLQPSVYEGYVEPCPVLEAVWIARQARAEREERRIAA